MNEYRYVAILDDGPAELSWPSSHPGTPARLGQAKARAKVRFGKVDVIEQTREVTEWQTLGQGRLEDSA